MQHKNLASERTRLGLNQTECAKMLGVSINTLVRYEADVDAMPCVTLRKACDLFGCSVEYLLDLTDERLPRS